jgi:hypothetical protein
LSSRHRETVNAGEINLRIPGIDLKTWLWIELFKEVAYKMERKRPVIQLLSF